MEPTTVPLALVLLRARHGELMNMEIAWDLLFLDVWMARLAVVFEDATAAGFTYEQVAS